MVKITEIGCIWVMTTMPFASPVVDVVARVDLAQADAAGDRRGDAAVDEIEPGVVDLRLVGLDRALVLATSDAWVSTAARDRVCCDQRLVAREVELRVLEQRLVLASVPCACCERDLIGPRVDLGEQVALLDHWPSVKLTLTSWPLICVCTVTVASGVTVPSARITIGMSALDAAAMPTGVAWPCAKRPRPPVACWVVLLCVVMYQPAATTTATPIPNLGGF